LSSFEVAPGRSPSVPWDRRELALVLEGLADLARHAVAPGTFAAFADEHAGVLTQWQAFADLETAQREALAARAGALGTWVLSNVDMLAEWASRAPQATAGDALVHGDIRADNILIDGNRAWIVDWPYASVGAPWLDLATFLPSVEMQGGGSAHAIFAAHPLARDVPHEDLRALVAALAGYFFVQSLQPEVPEIPTLRAFQWAQAVPAIRWLRAVEPRVAT
ncbi:MAG TPA: phosphotransferase, partial [Demequinaceae bacterium]